MSSSLLEKQCPACLVCLTWMLSEIRDRWPYEFCFVGYYIQDLFEKARSIPTWFESTFFSERFVKVQRCDYTVITIRQQPGSNSISFN